MEITNKIKVFAQYIGQKVKVTNKEYINGGYIGTILGVCSVRGLLVDTGSSDGDEKIDNCKLILKPFYQITNEDAYEVAKAYFNEGIQATEIFILPKGNDLTIIEYKKSEYDSEYLWLSYNEPVSVDVYQKLIALGYDYKQQLLDDKTLQEAGLAIYE